MNPRKILVAQGGGPTAVINQSLVGVVLEKPSNTSRERRFRNVRRLPSANAVTIIS